MLFNTTHINKKEAKEIERLVGKSFSFLKALKFGGSGSGRMIINHVSSNFNQIKAEVSDINYGSIELRSKGIIVFVTKQLKRYSWAIPYYKLTFFNADFFSIHSEGNFISFKKDKKYHDNKGFIKKMMNFKLNATKSYFL